jgi:hypothetical protein
MNQAAEQDDDLHRPIRRSSRRSCLFILGMIAGILCGVVVVCSGVIYLVGRTWVGHFTEQWRHATMGDEIQASETAAHHFMTAISRDRVEDAYGSATKGFQSRQTLQQLRDLVNKHPALKDYQCEFARDGFFDPERNTYRGTVVALNGMTVSYTVVVVKDGRNWKVDIFTIP